MDTAIAGLQLVLGMSLAAMAVGVVHSYFMRPEDFFVKRLRPEREPRVTHMRLLVRAYLGAGLLTSCLWILGYLLVVAIVIGGFPGTLLVWLSVTLGASLATGSFAYFYLRLRRYGRPAPGAGYFTMRKP